ncbi:MAG TPA: DUF4340 domain-containing protein, partial [Spirochaetales bacterium]|nr:DUF4340 domain-containing protein [Spirochaetales bacterium]
MRPKTRSNIFLKAGSVSLALILCMQYLWVHREESRRPLSAPFLEYWSLHPLQRIEFYPSRILLEQKENRWIVYLDSREYPPNLNRLERFLSVTSNLKLTARDQATPIMLSRYGFTEADFARVTFYSSGKARTFLLGGPGPKGSEEYCLPEGEGVIYKLSDSLSYYAHQPLSYWIRLQLFDPPLQESNISAVGIHTGEPGGRVVWLYRRRELHRSESWQVERELTVSIPGEQIKPYLEALVTVEGVDVAPS